MKNKTLRPFHLAFPIIDIEKTKKWYINILGCTIGRESEQWVDFNFFGHQISGHLVTESNSSSKNEVDKKKIPVRHFGIILSFSEWESLAARLNYLEIDFIIKPYVRFKKEKGEQATLFIKDPSNNYLEFKAFKNDEMIFQR